MVNDFSYLFLVSLARMLEIQGWIIIVRCDLGIFYSKSFIILFLDIRISVFQSYLILFNLISVTHRIGARYLLFDPER